MAVKLNERGVFSWNEWAEVLGSEIKAHPELTYYECWLAALEHLAEGKKLVTSAERVKRIAAWDEAARATPHGQPIELKHSLP
jgi:nitrile hydratase accessory protein